MSKDLEAGAAGTVIAIVANMKTERDAAVSERDALAAELATARNAIEALGRQLREAREREKEWRKLLEHAECVIPYVSATLSLGNIFPSETRPDWVEVHGGRAFSSRSQLDGWLVDIRAALKGAGA